jgi:hypothetical protein
MRSAHLTVLVLFAIAGCAPYPQFIEHWARPGGTELDFAAWDDTCERAALKQYPPMTEDGPGYFVPAETRCEPTSGGTNCIVINSGYLPRAGASDLNALPREGAQESCLIAGGWRPVTSPEEADAITRSSMIEPRLPEAAVGKAAGYCERIFYRQRNVSLMAAYQNKFDQCVMTRAREPGAS